MLGARVSASWGVCGFGEFLVHLVHALGWVGHVVVEPPGQECEERAGEEPCSNLDRDGGPVAGVGATFESGSVQHVPVLRRVSPLVHSAEDANPGENSPVEEARSTNTSSLVSAEITRGSESLVET